MCVCVCLCVPNGVPNGVLKQVQLEGLSKPLFRIQEFWK